MERRIAGRAGAARTALAFALTYLMVWGGVPAPALAEVAGEAQAAAQDAGGDTEVPLDEGAPAEAELSDDGTLALSFVAPEGGAYEFLVEGALGTSLFRSSDPGEELASVSVSAQDEAADGQGAPIVLVADLEEGERVTLALVGEPGAKVTCRVDRAAEDGALPEEQDGLAVEAGVVPSDPDEPEAPHETEPTDADESEPSPTSVDSEEGQDPSVEDDVVPPATGAVEVAAPMAADGQDETAGEGQDAQPATIAEDREEEAESPALSAPSIMLTEQSVDPVTLSVGSTVNVSLAKGEQWVGVFAAKDRGCYAFSIDNDRYLSFYEDEALSERRYTQYSVEGAKKVYRQTMYAGDVVYLSVSATSWSSVTCSVGVERLSVYDLSNASIGFQSSLPAPLDADKFVLNVYDAMDNLLTEGIDYSLSFWKSTDGTSWSKLASAPTQPGTYAVRADAVQGGAYSGSTERREMYLFDSHDFSTCSQEVRWGSDKRSHTGKPVTPPEVAFYSKTEVLLTEGVDYRLSRYEDMSGNDLGKAAPSAVGTYYMVFEGVSPYYGEQSVLFEIYDTYDITQYSHSVEGDTSVAYTGKPVTIPTVDVYRRDSDNTKIIHHLKEGKDYEFSHVLDGRGNDLGKTAPSEVGSYRLVFAGKAPYSGEVSVWFSIYDPYDLSSGGSASLYGATYYDSNTSMDVFLLGDTPVTPRVHVYDAGWSSTLEEGTDYVVSYANNSKAGIASVTITGTGDYYGSLIKRYRLVKTCTFSQYLSRTSCQVVADGNTDYFNDRYSDPIYYLYTGLPIMPTVSFSGESERYILKEGRDFTVSYTDDNGSKVGSPVEVGSYRIVLTAVSGGVCEGTIAIPFSIVRTKSLTDSMIRSISTGRQDSGIHNTSKSTGNKWTSDYVYEEADTGLQWSVYDGAKALVENFDYVVSSAYDSLTNILTFVFTGMGDVGNAGTTARGSYTGTVSTRVYLANTKQTVFDDNFGSAEGVVYVDDAGSIKDVVVRKVGFAQGVDYDCAYVMDAYDKKVTSAKPGEKVYLHIVGKGAYEGAAHTIVARVEANSEAKRLDKGATQLTLSNGIRYVDGGDERFCLLKGATPSVSLRVYGRNVLLSEGQDFTVATKVSSDGGQMDLTVKADDESRLISGSRTVRVKLYDSYPIADFVETVRIGGIGNEGGSTDVASPSVVSLTYSGVPFFPTVGFSSKGSSYPRCKTTLLNASSQQVSTITGAGKYTLVITGTDDWSGSFRVPLEVTSSAGAIDVSSCTLTLGDTRLVNGAATPSVKLGAGASVFQQGSDYTVEYGSNTEAGGKAWVKVTAVQGGPLRGMLVKSFVVSDGSTTKDLSSGAYDLEAKLPGGTYVSMTHGGTSVRSFNVADVKVGPVIRVVNTSNGNVLVSGNYDVRCGAAEVSDIAYVQVVGKGEYTGSIRANYFALPRDPVDIANAKVEVAAQTYTGKALTPKVAVTVDSESLVEGEDYVLSYGNNVNAGTASVLVTGKNAYTGKKSATFVINPADTSKATISAIPDQPHTGKAITPKPTVTHNGRTLAEGTDYTLSYGSNVDAGTATVTVTGKGNYKGLKAATFRIVATSEMPTVSGGIDWAPVYDPVYYVERHADVKKAFTTGGKVDYAKALTHFVNHGMAEGRQGNASFVVIAYRARNLDLQKAFGNDLPKYYRHYVTNGKAEGRDASALPTIYGGVDWSPVYDPEWYVAHNADVLRAYTSGSRVDFQKVLQHFATSGQREGRQGNASFVVRAYRARNLDLQRAFGNDLPKYYRHYVTNGAKEGRDASALPTSYGGVDWSPVYDPEWYVAHSADVLRAYTSGNRVDFQKVLVHFATSGQREGRQGNASFVVRAYKARNLDLQKAFGTDLPKYYRHYVTNGAKEGRDASALPTTYGGVDWSPVYDPEWYLAHNADVAKAYTKGSRVDFQKVLQHFATSGQREGRQGNASFVVRAYKARNLDLQKAFGTDLAKYYKHYVTNGRKEGRDASALPTTYGGLDWSPVYDPAYYAEHNADVARAYAKGSRVDFDKVLAHFVAYGQREGRQGNASFVVRAYRARNLDLQRAYGNDLAKYYRHYVTNGAKEGRDASALPTTYGGVDWSPVYDPAWYAEHNADVVRWATAGSRVDFQKVLQHFVTSGQREGRQGSATFSAKAYRARYADLNKAFGTDLPKYYRHYVQHGMKEGRSGRP